MDNNTSGLFPGLFSAHAEVVDHVVEFFCWVLDDVNFVGNGGSSWWLITGNHDNLDTSGSAFVDREIDLQSWWIVKGDDTDEGESVHWESSWGAFVVSLLGFHVETPCFPCLDIELVGLGIFAGIEGESSEGEDSLSESTEGRVGFVNFGSEFISEWNFLSVEEDLIASVEDSLWCTFHEDTKSTFLGSEVSDEEVEFEFRVEWNDDFSVFSSVVLVNPGWAGISSIDKAHDGLSELDKTGLGGITLAFSVDVKHLGFSFSQSGFHVGFIGGIELGVLKRSNGDFLHSGVKLLGLILRWVIVEDGVSSENDGFNEGSEAWIVRVILDLHLLVWLSESHVLLVGLVVDGAVDGLSVVEHVGDGHSVLGKGTSLIRADARGGSKSLDRLQVLNEHHLSSHSLGGKSE